MNFKYAMNIFKNLFLLNKKKDENKDFDHIETLYGVGYRYRDT